MSSYSIYLRICCGVDFVKDLELATSPRLYYNVCTKGRGVGSNGCYNTKN